MSGEKTSVAARDENLSNSPIGSNEDDATVVADKDAICLWNDQEFADSDVVCAEGVAYVCNYGSWMKLPGSC